MALTLEEEQELDQLKSEYKDLSAVIQQKKKQAQDQRAQAALAEQNKPSPLGSAARGVGQGLTFGFSDEMLAALRAMHPDMTYDQAVKEERTKLKLDEETNPISSLAGEFAGGIVPGMAMAPLAAASGLTRLAKGAGFLGKVGAGVLEGAAAGGLYGAGKSEDGNMADEVASGAKVGGIVGGAIPVVGKVFNKLGSAMKSEHAPEFVNDIASSFGLGTEGQGLISSGSVKGIKAEVEAAGKQIPDLLKSELSGLGKLKEHLYNNSKKTIRVDDLLQNTLSGIERSSSTSMNPDIMPIYKKLMGLKNKYNFDIPLSEADNLVNIIDDWGKFAEMPPDINSLKSQIKDRLSKQITDSEARVLLKNASGEIQDTFEGLAGKQRSSVGNSKVSSELQPYGQNAESSYRKFGDVESTQLPIKDINDSMHSIMDADDILKSIITPEYAGDKADAAAKMAQVIRNLKRTSDSGENASIRFKDAMSKIREANPNLADQITEMASEASLKHSLSNKARGVNTLAEGSSSGKGLLSGIVGDLKGLAGVGPANLMGKSYRRVAEFAKTPKKFIESFEPYFKPGSEIYRMMTDIANNPSESARAAGINSLMQISAFRNLMNKDDESGEEIR